MVGSVEGVSSSHESRLKNRKSPSLFVWVILVGIYQTGWTGSSVYVGEWDELSITASTGMPAPPPTIEPGHLAIWGGFLYSELSSPEWDKLPHGHIIIGATYRMNSHFRSSKYSSSSKYGSSSSSEERRYAPVYRQAPAPRRAVYRYKSVLIICRLLVWNLSSDFPVLIKLRRNCVYNFCKACKNSLVIGIIDSCSFYAGLDQRTTMADTTRVAKGKSLAVEL